MSPRDQDSGVELRLMPYLVAVAEGGTFTQAAARTAMAQPTVSQQVRRLERIIGAPLLSRERDGVHLPAAGRVRLRESRAVLSMFEHGLRRSRQAAGLDRLRLRFVLPSDAPESLGATTAIRLQARAAAADVEVAWPEAPMEAEFSAIRRREAAAGLGWLMPDPAALPEPQKALSLGKYEPEVWIPAAGRAGFNHRIGLDKLARMDVVYDPRRASPAVYDSWLAALRRDGQDLNSSTLPGIR